MSDRVKILIVDDEPNIRRLLGGVLDDEGYATERLAAVGQLVAQRGEARAGGRERGLGGLQHERVDRHKVLPVVFPPLALGEKSAGGIRVNGVHCCGEALHGARR